MYMLNNKVVLILKQTEYLKFYTLHFARLKNSVTVMLKAAQGFLLMNSASSSKNSSCFFTIFANPISVNFFPK